MSDHELVNGLTYERDVRHTDPNIDALRRRNFRMGWDDATHKNTRYGTRAMTELTWQNLGNRLGQLLGHASAAMQDEVYDVLVRVQEAQVQGQTE